MMIMPSRELMKYVAMDERGNWVHSEDMPIELKEKFEEFVERAKKANDYKQSFGKQKD